jgi:carbamoyl-phosphate synthase small subunit
VQDLRTGAVAITAQNHNYQVDIASLDPAAVEITHLSLNDGSLEGMRLRRRPVFCVQYHPEAAPGPHDAHDLVRRSSCGCVRCDPLRQASVRRPP